MNKLIFIVLVLIGGSGIAQAQKTIEWADLTAVTFEETYYERYDTKYFKPTFDESVKALDGKEIRISGYVIAVEPESGFYVLSANPFSACFFCGNAGPETVIELEFDKWPEEYETDKYMTFTGVLNLNADNIFRLNYILTGAKEE